MNRYLIDLGVVLAVISLFWWWSAHERRIGEQKIRNEDKVVLDKRILDDKVAIAIQKSRADTAEGKYLDEHKVFTAYAKSHPVGVSQLCRPKGNSSPVSGSATADRLNAKARPAGTVVQPVPKTDNGFDSDRATLLGAFAGLAEESNAQLREWQGR